MACKEIKMPVQTEVFAFAFQPNDISTRADLNERRAYETCLCANPHLCLLSLIAVAFHSPPVTIKKEPQSPGSDPSQSCSHKQSFSYPSGEQCLYARYLLLFSWKFSVSYLKCVTLGKTFRATVLKSPFTQRKGNFSLPLLVSSCVFIWPGVEISVSYTYFTNRQCRWLEFYKVS